MASVRKMDSQHVSSYSVGSPPPTGSNSLQMSLEERLSAMLSSENFTVPAYLNLALEPRFDGDDLQQRMAELALQLQLQTQACHEDIGRIGAELQAILPRCSADIGRIGVSLDGLKTDAASLLESASIKGEENVSSSLETLSTLHSLQSSLQRTKEILTAAATWDSTLSSIAPLLAQQNLAEAVNALAQLENGERALRGMPNREEREQAIAKVRQQVSVLLQPQLKHALANMNTRLAPLQQCVALYSKLGKMETLQEEYIKTRPSSLHKAWFEYKPSYGEQGPDPRIAAEQFLDWLPGWFDAVLSMITEERRQSGTIFGSKLVPTIVVGVFRECFRPILASFQSRLESIHPLGTAVRYTDKGSLESICAIYESTLRFLSLSYEAVASGWFDMVESDLLDASGALELYNDITAIFLQVMTPFTSYQQRLSQLEVDYLGGQTLAIARDIRQAVTAVSALDLQSLQTAIEQLQELSSFCFPLAEGAIARFELLNGGYGPARALAVVDRIVSGHSGELTMAVKSLSAAIMADEEKLAKNMDEPHVLCALEILKLAGSFRHDLRSLEKKTRERLVLLAERMEKHTAQENLIQEAAAATKGTKARNAFSLPDSLSEVEIDSLVTEAVCGGDDQHMGGSHEVLKRLTACESGGTTTLFVEVNETARRFFSSCQTFVFDMCSCVPRLHLGGMSTLPSWKGASADNMDSYGTLPQQYMTQVGEHMLSLVQALEPFASDKEALRLANEVMENVREIALGPWWEFLRAAGSPAGSSDDLVKELTEGKQLVDLVLGNASAIYEETEEHEDDEDDHARDSAAFCDTWLDVVGMAITGRILERIMLIPSLSPKGCEHLTVDLNYLVNVLSALGIQGHPHPLLQHIAELAAMDENSLVEQIRSRDLSSPLSSSLAAFERRLASRRGIPTD